MKGQGNQGRYGPALEPTVTTSPASHPWTGRSRTDAPEERDAEDGNDRQQQL